MRIIPILMALVALSIACAKKQPEFVVAHRYALTGTIKSLNPKEQTASIDAAAIPNYMEAMRMEYQIASKAEFNSLHVGEKIWATLNVSAAGDESTVTDIHEQGSGNK